MARRGAIADLPRGRRLAVAVATVLCLAGAAPQAHESEQYSLPAGRDFADLGPLFSRTFLAAIRDAVADTNAAIDAALAAGDRPGEVQALQSADRVAAQVWARLFVAYPANELLDLGLLGAATRAQYPGLVTMYRPVQSVYDDPWLMLDLSKPVRALFRAGSVSAGGMVFGTDKIIHFIHVGRLYHLRYLAAVQQGASESEAMLQAVRDTAANPLLSEDGMLGLFTTGIRSNADLAADYAGLKFYRNLSEAVQVGGVRLPPMLQREGEHWRVAAQDAEQDEDTVFTRFVSAHWNEVLNPNSYLRYVGERMRQVIASRCADVADWYRDAHGQPLNTAWFAARQQQLATFDGEPYGHELPDARPVSVAEICAAPGAQQTAAAADAPLWWAASLPAPQAADALGRSRLWWAAAEGRSDAVERLAALGEPLDQADIDGDTPLHAALRRGRLATAQLLVARGADAGRAARYGVTPLLLAAAGRHAAMVALLLRAGADPNAQDQFGRTALHESAQRGDIVTVTLLLRHGADATLPSRHGGDALQVARRAGHEALLPTLRASGPALAGAAPRQAQLPAAAPSR